MELVLPLGKGISSPLRPSGRGTPRPRSSLAAPLHWSHWRSSAGCLSAVALAARARAKTRKRPSGLGFNMSKVSDKPAEDFAGGPKALEIVKYPHPALRRPNAEVTDFGDSLRQLSENLFRTMYESEDPPGVGLAAPQCGVNLRVMVYNHLRSEEGIDPAGEAVFVNPRITECADETIEEMEGCLSFPGFSAAVVRPTWIEVEAVDLDGNPYKKRLDGWQSRLFQHEYDHLDGIVYIDHISKEDKKLIAPKLKKLVSDYTAGGGKDPMP